MDSHEVLKTYAMFYVSENDEFDTKKKLDLLNVIENADESGLMDLFEKNEIEAPLDLFEMEEKGSAELIGESAILVEQASWLLEGDVLLELDLKNKLKDMVGMETDLKYKISKAAGSAKKALEKQLDNIQDKIGDMKDAIAKGAGKAVDKAKDVAGDVADKAKDVAGDVADKAKDVAGDVSDKAGDIAKAAGKTVSKGYETAKDVAGDVGEKVSGAAGKAAEFAQQNPGAVGGAVAAAAALTAGVMAYRKFFSKAAQACKSAPNRDQCMAQYKMKAKQAQISTLAAGKSKCAKTKNPQACSSKIDAKIAALKSKMRG